MRISKEQLQKIIAEEVREHVKKKLVSESKAAPRTVKATPSILKRIIAEEASKFKNKPVKATPEMLKRIIAEEAARVNEMDPARPLDGSQDPVPHPDNRGVDYEDLDRLEDKRARDAARRELELKNVDFDRRYLMTSNFARAVRANTSILVDVKTKKIICDLKKYSSCANEIVDKLNELGVPGLLYSDPKAYQEKLFNILNSHREKGKELAGEELFSENNTAIASIHLIHKVLGIEIEKEEDILSIRYEEYNNLYK